MKPVQPQRLRHGDVIGIVSPSSPLASICPRRFNRGLAELRSQGFDVRVGEAVQHRVGHSAGTIEERVADLHAMFADDDVTAVIATIGGSSSHQLLEDLDFELIRANPKVFIGYSDITALHVGMLCQANLTTFLGPAVLPQFGEYGGVDPFTVRTLRAVTMNTRPAGELEISNSWIAERLMWDSEDDRPRARVVNAGPRTLREGSAEGPLIAGNVGTLLLLAGTRWWPTFDGTVLCVEDDESETPESIDRYLTQLRHTGVFESIAGLVLGRFHPDVGFSPADSLDDIVARATRGYQFPVAADFDFGHTDPMLTLPLGVAAHLDAQGSAPRLSLLESAVT